VLERAASFSMPVRGLFALPVNRSFGVCSPMKRGTPFASSAVAQTKASHDHWWKLQSTAFNGVSLVGKAASASW